MTAEAQGKNAASAFNVKPTINEGYKWKTTKEGKFTESRFAQFTNEEKTKYVDIVCGHTHCICGKTHNGVGTHATEEEQTFLEWEDMFQLPSTPGYYCLVSNVSLSKSWEPADGTVLCLNGKMITANGDFDAVTVDANVTFTLTNCSTDGKITHVAGKNGRGVAIKSNGKFIMYDGTIDGNSYSYSNACYNPDSTHNSYGGGVCNDGTFTMNGGVISNNKVSSAEQNFGAGVFNYNGRSFHMNAGTIRNNEAGADGDSNNKGGGVYNAGTFTMKDGAISGNTAMEGGGVLTQIITGTATFNMEGGTITGNAAKGSSPYGGGVAVRMNGVFSVSGNANVISNNLTDTSGTQTANNVYLYSEKRTMAIGIMENEAKIGVSSGQAAKIKTESEEVQVSTATTSASYVINDIFFSDDDELELYCVGESEGILKLRKATTKVYTITWDANGGRFENASKTKIGKVNSGESIKAPATNPTKENYVFVGWYDTADGGNMIQSYGTAVANTTYYAHWAEKTTSSSGGGYYTPSSAVTTSGSTDSKVTSSPTEVKRETKTDANGSSVTTATVTVSAANQREILRQAKANKSGEIVIKISQNDVKDAAKIALQLEKSFIEAVVTDTDAKLIIQTPDGERTFTQDELKKLAAEATDKIVTVDPAEAEQAQPEQPADTLTPAQEKLVKGVENTNIDLRSQRTPGGNILLTWAKEKGYKVDYFEIYRSTKRSGGYGRKPFFRTPNGNWTKYLNTKNIKEGSTYYYKIRGVRIIDGKKYYTEYSTKAWRSVK